MRMRRLAARIGQINAAIQRLGVRERAYVGGVTTMGGQGHKGGGSVSISHKVSESKNSRARKG